MLRRKKDRALRTVAEMENLRRRTAQDVEKAHKFALEKFATELLPVLDNLERTIQVADKQNEAVKPLLEGVELTLKSMANSVAKFGVIAIDPQGQSFDPNQHQAMSMVENAHPAMISHSASASVVPMPSAASSAAQSRMRGRPWRAAWRPAQAEE